MQINRLAAAVALSGALVAGGSSAAWAGPASAPAVPAAAGLSRPSVTVPAAAMLQPADLGGTAPTPVTDDYWSALQPPQPCATVYPSTALRQANRAVTAMIGVDDRPTVILEDVAVYRSTGAHRYLGDLRRALAACGGVDAQGATWDVLATGVAGDESMVLRQRVYLEFAGLYKDTYLVLARTGRALVVLADVGWETGNGHRDLVESLSRAAVRRAAMLPG